jgi:hypothetical protein
MMVNDSCRHDMNCPIIDRDSAKEIEVHVHSDDARSSNRIDLQTFFDLKNVPLR